MPPLSRGRFSLSVSCRVWRHWTNEVPGGIESLFSQAFICLEGDCSGVSISFDLFCKAFQKARAEARDWTEETPEAGDGACSLCGLHLFGLMQRQQGGCVSFVRLSRKHVCLSWAFVKCGKLESCTMLTSLRSLNTQTKEGRELSLLLARFPPRDTLIQVMYLAGKRE